MHYFFQDSFSNRQCRYRSFFMACFLYLLVAFLDNIWNKQFDCPRNKNVSPEGQPIITTTIRPGPPLKGCKGYNWTPRFLRKTKLAPIMRTYLKLLTDFVRIRKICTLRFESIAGAMVFMLSYEGELINDHIPETILLDCFCLFLTCDYVFL